jgi:hypothetical protein
MVTVSDFMKKKKSVKKPVKKAKKLCKKKCGDKCVREKAYGDPSPVVPVEKLVKPPEADKPSFWNKFKKFLGL